MFQICKLRKKSFHERLTKAQQLFTPCDNELRYFTTKHEESLHLNFLGRQPHVNWALDR